MPWALGQWWAFCFVIVIVHFCLDNVDSVFSLQCFDAVGWATGTLASGLQKAWCWFVGGDDLTGALHDLQLQLSLTTTSIVLIYLFIIKSYTKYNTN